MTSHAQNLEHLFPGISPVLVQELMSLLGPNSFIPAERIAEKYHSDWSFDKAQCPAALLLPEDTNQVSQILSLCNQAGQAIVVQGGLTGLAGGATPRVQELALSLEKLSGIESINKNALTMSVKAGTNLADIHTALENTGLDYGVDYGARNTCQIGGNVATNAGGTQVIHFGMTQAQVLGMEAVLADGTVIDSMNHLLKNNAGYDLKQLFIGSEGTLGVVTRLVLRLFPETTSSCTGLFALNDFQDTVILLNLCRSIFGDSLHGFEVMWEDFYKEAIDIAGEAPLPHQQQNKLYALVEIKGRDQARDELIFRDLFEQCLEQNVLIDGAIAETEEDAKHIWGIRYTVKTMLKTKTPLANFDIGIPIDQMERFVECAKEKLADNLPNIEALFFGHIGDGNLHILATTGHESDVDKIYELIYPICAEFGGTVSAEHGIGTHRKSRLKLSRTDAEIALMKSLKQSLDPKGILNPGRIFDL